MLTDGRLDELLHDAGFVRLPCYGRQNVWQSPKTHIVTIRRGNKHTWAYVSSILTMGQVNGELIVTLFQGYFGQASPIHAARTTPTPPPDRDAPN